MAIDINIPSQVKNFANLAAFPVTGAVKTIYIAEDTNKTYRWTGSAYVEISASGSVSGFVPYTGATGNVDLGTNDLKVNEVFLYDAPNNNYGSIHYTDGNFHIEDGDGHNLLVLEDGFIQLHKSNMIQSNLFLTSLSTTRDHYLPNESGTFALTQQVDAKQDTLVSGTNIKTINGNSVLGSGDLVVSGGGGLQGVHTLLPIATGSIVPIVVNGNGITTVGTIANRLYAIPFIPNRTFTSSNLYLNVTVLGSGVNGRILIYSDLNGKPDTKIFESSNLDCSTTGLKTATTSQTFTAGTTYWICTQFSGICTTHGYSVASLMNIYGSGTSISCSYYNSPTFGSAPSPFGTPFVAGSNLPAVFITAS